MRPTKVNANPLFQGLKSQPSYLAALDISDAERKLLRNARRDIRTHLRAAFASIAAWVSYGEIANPSLVTNSAFHQLSIPVRFLTQGSYVYGTLNGPAHSPPQQIDLDDGVYIPTPINLLNGPALLASGFFLLVERSLAPLCAARGWQLDRSKSTCVRVQLSDRAHIDIPLFTAPTSEFERLEKAYAAVLNKSMNKKDDINGFFRGNRGRTLRLQPDQIYMAHRQKGWEQSDPRRLQDWYEYQVERLGPVLRRVSRYMKGWRDFHWYADGPSSILLMTSAVSALNRLAAEPADDRDDLVVLEVAKRLSQLWQGAVPSPVPGCKNLDHDWSLETRQSYIRAADAFAEEVRSALEETFNQTIVVRRFRSVFGSRFPDAPASVSRVDADQTRVSIIRSASSQPLLRTFTNTSG